MWIETKFGTAVNLTACQLLESVSSKSLINGDLVTEPFAVVAGQLIIAGVPDKDAGIKLIRAILDQSLVNAHGVMRL